MALTKVSSNLVADDAIVTGKIADGGVGTADLAANAVTTAKIAQNNVTAHHIADGSVTVTQLGADAVTAAKVADDAISEEHLDKTIISDMTAVTPVAGDFVLLGDTSDSNNLKKSALTLLLNSNVDLSSKLNLSGGTMTGNLVIGTSGFTTATINSTRGSGNIGGMNFSASGTNKAQVYGTVDGQLKLGTGGDGSADSTVALTLDASQNATFAGTLGVSGISTLNVSAIIKSAGTNNVPADLSLWHTDGSIASGDDIAVISAEGSDSGGSPPYQGAKISFDADAVWDTGSSNYYPTNINFFTQDNSGTDTIAAGPRMIIQANGNVGIGTTSPAKPLHISSADNQPLRVESTDAYSGIEIKDNGSSTLPPLISALSDDFIFYGGHGSSRPAIMFMDSSSGNVGIGTTSPTVPLDIYNGSGWGGLDVDGTSGGEIRIQKAGTTYGQLFASDSHGFVINATGGLADILFQSGGSTKMIMLDTGKVGIGTSTPANKLHLKAGASGASSFDSRYNLTIEDDGENYIAMYAPNNSYAGLRFLNAASSIRGHIDYYHGSTGDKMLIYAQNHIEFGYPTVGVQHIFKADGKVGIGTASPSKKLHVSMGGTVVTGQTYDAMILQNSDAVTLRIVDAGDAGGNGGHAGLGNDNGNLNIASAGVMTFSTALTANEALYGGGAGTGGDERMRIGSGGEVGIGSNNPQRLLHLYANSSGDTAVMRIQDNGSHVAGIELYSGHGNWGIYNSDTVGDALEFRDDSAGVTRMIINSTGRVGIGTTSPQQALHIFQTEGGVGAKHATIRLGGYSTTGAEIAAYRFDGNSNNQGLIFSSHDATNGIVERMRIESTGDIRFGIASAGLTAGEVYTFDNQMKGNTLALRTQGGTGMYSIDMLNTTGGTCKHVLIRAGASATSVGEITSTGNNACQFTSLSDYRLKENVDYTWDATTRLKQLKPARFNWINDEDNTLVDGFMAHEVSSIVPVAVTGTKDATETKTNCVLLAGGGIFADGVTESKWAEGKAAGTYPSDTTWVASKEELTYQQMDPAKLVPLMVKTIQELEARIKTLEG